DSMKFEASRFSSAREVLQKINADLSAAKALLAEDPIRSNNSRIADLNQFAYEKYNSLLDRRGSRFNYYAVVALQTMAAQWAGDIEGAGRLAEEVINELRITNSITLATAASFGSNVNM